MAYIEDEIMWIEDIEFTLFSDGEVGISIYDNNLLSKRGVEELITTLQARMEKFRKED